MKCMSLSASEESDVQFDFLRSFNSKTGKDAFMYEKEIEMFW